MLDMPETMDYLRSIIGGANVFQTCAIPSVGEDPIDNRRRLVLAA